MCFFIHHISNCPGPPFPIRFDQPPRFKVAVVTIASPGLDRVKALKSNLVFVVPHVPESK